MTPELQLCPCCAAHLRVPSALHLMRCNNCEAELVAINQGGVRGLAYLPSVDGVVPYSVPAQRGRIIHGHVDGRELLEFRRRIVVEQAERKQRFWSSMASGTLALLALACVTGVAGLHFVGGGPRATAEIAALAFLGSFVSLPLIAYVALNFHGRARMAAEAANRWR